MNKSILIIIGIILYSTLVIGANVIYGDKINIPTTETTPIPITNINNTNMIVINITNNITTYVTSWNNITNNLTSYVNLTTYVNTTNDIFNNITTEIYQNVTYNITNNISNYFYSGWLTIENNMTYNITSYNNITVENNITNYIDNYITNNITNNLTAFFNVTYSFTLENNVSTNITVNIFNITNTYNYTYYYNDTYLLQQLGLKLDVSDQRYNDTGYCDAKMNNLNSTIIEHTNILNELVNTKYGEITDYDGSYDTLTLTTVNVYYNISNYPSTEFNNGFYSTNGNIVCNASGLYVITYSYTIALNALNNLEFLMYINDVQEYKSFSGIYPSSNNYVTVSISFIEYLDVDDVINVRVRNIDSSGKIITFYRKTIYAVKVSD
jgi:hypothetical protein